MKAHDCKVLIVEDEQLVAEHIRFILESHGYRIVAMASTGEEAIMKASHSHPHLVLMDIRLSGSTDGIQAARVIDWLFNIPVVFVTANSNDHKFQQITTTNRYGFVKKPFSEEELTEAVRRALRAVHSP